MIKTMLNKPSLWHHRRRLGSHIGKQCLGVLTSPQQGWNYWHNTSFFFFIRTCPCSPLLPDGDHVKKKKILTARWDFSRKGTFRTAQWHRPGELCIQPGLVLQSFQTFKSWMKSSHLHFCCCPSYNMALPLRQGVGPESPYLIQSSHFT